MEAVPPRRRRDPVPHLPVLALGLTRAAWRDGAGTTAEITLGQARERLGDGLAPLVCFRPAVLRRLDLRAARLYDAMELFALVRPARFALPTIRGLAMALGQAPPGRLADEPAALLAAATELLAELSQPETAAARDLAPIVGAMAAAGWIWAPLVEAALGAAPPPQTPSRAVAGLEIWRHLPEWAERAPEPPPSQVPVRPEEAQARLAALLPPTAEGRPQQRDYTAAVAAAFAARDNPDAPRIVLAEAGTGVGKTLGYVAPASLWAERNGGAVWISTFTRNLQHQIDQELDRLYPDPLEKRKHVAIRKGRENYLCLLNYEEAVQAARLNPSLAIALGLIARWIGASRDGALVAGDLPGWLADIAGRAQVAALTDRRGECIYAACPHYSRCFIEHGIRRARRSRLVVANHALVMIQAALAAADANVEGNLPTRLVFDEGHHVFHAADSAFAALLSGREMAELRRWIRGGEGGGGRSSRIRGLRARLVDLLEHDKVSAELVNEAAQAATALPGEGWLTRLTGGAPSGPGEAFLALVRQQVLARAPDRDAGYGLECDTRPLVPGLSEAAAALQKALTKLARPLDHLAERLRARLADEAEELETPARLRLEAVSRGLKRRGALEIGAWRAMLKALDAETPRDFVDWFALEREFGREVEIGMHRRWVDPTRPFAEAVLKPAHGVVVTSASLRDGTGEPAEDWRVAAERSGAAHLATPAERAAVESPFDYARQTRLFVVRDVSGADVDQVAAAYRALFLAAGGGALGLFTAIQRLRGVHKRIAAPLEEAGLPLLAQHIDGYDVATLVDIFRAEQDACLLGTDAVRDGVDVPGRSLRLIVFDRVPWPRPDILHRARREAFGGNRYDDRETRFRLKQAFGRLIRRADDIGVFVMLDARLPTRLCGAFPAGVEPRRVGLAEAVAETRAFLAAEAGAATRAVDGAG